MGRDTDTTLLAAIVRKFMAGQPLTAAEARLIADLHVQSTAALIGRALLPTTH